MTGSRSSRRKRQARAAFVVTMASIAAACTSQESSQPGPTLTTIATTTTTSIPATTTTEAVPTTTIPDTTTTEAPTTTVATPTGPVDASIPILTGGATGDWLLLGTWEADRWASALDSNDEPITPDIGGSPTFAISGLGFSQMSGVVGPNGEACIDGREGPSIDASVPPPEPPGFGYSAVALPSSWSLRPRPAALLEGGVPAYEQLGIDAFAGEPVDASQGRVTQIVIVDLDGDGDDEAIVAFERVETPGISGTTGDLAAMLLVDTTSRASQTIISNVVVDDESDEGDEDFVPIIERYRALDVADLNGDGRMEVVIHAWQLEVASVTVYEYDGTTLNEVLTTSCST